MLTIDDPEIERLIREEAERTGEEPLAVLRRRVLGATGTESGRVAPAEPRELPDEPAVVRNGVLLLPRRAEDPVVTTEMVRRLLGESE